MREEHYFKNSVAHNVYGPAITRCFNNKDKSQNVPFMSTYYLLGKFYPRDIWLKEREKFFRKEKLEKLKLF